MPPPRPDAYSERLFVPLRWWVQATMLLASLWLAFIVSMPEWAAWSTTGVLLLVTFGFFVVGRECPGGCPGRRAVRRAGAHLRSTCSGPPSRSTRMETRRVHGVDADARAFLLTRPYLKRSVKVTVADPADRTPYWLVSTRHPHRLAAALTTSGAPD